MRVSTRITPRILCAAILFMLVAVTTGAFDMGVSIQNITGFRFEPMEVAALVQPDGVSYLNQADKVILWFAINAHPAFNANLRLGWMFKLTGGETDLYYDTLNFNPLELLKSLERFSFSGSVPVEPTAFSNFSYTIGRYKVRDFTGHLVDTTLDGGEFGFRWTNTELRFGVWYGGVIDRNISNLYLSPADTAGYESDWAFGPPRLVNLLEFTIRNIGRQNLTILLAGQEDLRQGWELLSYGDGALYTQYAGVALHGYLIPNLHYRALGMLGTGVRWYIDDPEAYIFTLSQLYELSVNYYLKGEANSRVGFRFLYTSGDSDGRADWEGTSFAAGTDLSTMFTPVSGKRYGYVFTPRLGNIFLFDFSYTLGAGRMAGFTFKDTPYFRSTPGPIDTETIPGSEGRFLGNEIMLEVAFRPLSDLGLSLSAGLFFPNSKVLVDGDIGFRTDLTLSVSF